MKTEVTAHTLAQGLWQLGVRPGMALEVHASLSQFGRVTGGANTVIEALMQAVGPKGTIVMPAFRLSPNLPLTEEDHRLGLTAKIRILPKDETRSAMGIVADSFRARPDVHTGEGIFRVAAWGKDATLHAGGLQPLIDGGGHALLLGVDIYRLSAMHYVEDALPAAIRERFAPSKEALAKYPEGQWMTEAWLPEGKPWLTIQQEAYEKGLIADTRIGDATCMFFQVKPVIELYRKALTERPFALYGLA